MTSVSDPSSARTGEPHQHVFRLADGVDVAVRLYPGPKAQKPGGALVYFHGGLFNSGSLEDADSLGRGLCTAVTVLSVDYPLAPHTPFPIVLERSYQMLRALVDKSDAVRIDRSQLFIGGDEAGGNLAAGLALLVRDRGLGTALAGQVLITPLLDASLTTESMRRAEGCPCQQAWSDYLPDPKDRVHPYASPLHCLRVAGLPPTLVLNGEFDPLRDEGQAYAVKLAAAGVPVRHHVFMGVPGRLVVASHPAFEQSVDAVKHFLLEHSIPPHRKGS